MSAVAIPRVRGAAGRAGLVVVFAALLLGVAKLVVAPSTARLAVAAAAAVAVLGAAVYERRSAVFILPAWLPALGFVRRLMTDLVGGSHLDPLLIVAPAAIVLLCAAAVSDGAAAHRTRLANAVLLLSVIAVCSALNPLQGSPALGGVGLLFVLVPMLAFWIGRSLDDDAMRRILWITAALAAAAAAYGLYQTFSGFPSWDAHWIAKSGYLALDIGGATRAFASFSSAAEYGYFLGIGLLLWATIGRARANPLLAFAAVGLISVALLYESMRTVVFAAFGAGALMLAARRGLPLVLALVLAVVLGAAVSFAVQSAAGSAADPQSLVGHQVAGIANPTDARVSTLPTHLLMIKEGVTAVVSHPAGLGLGVVTIAGRKFGGAGWSTEADPSNAAVSMGLPGLLAYVAVVAFGFQRTYALARRRRDPLALAALGLLTVVFLQWLNGGQYAVAYLPWLVLGWVDRAPLGLDEEEEDL